MNKRRILILGAAGRDFHNFLVYFKKNAYYQVVGFTATQIPGIDNKTFPTALAGQLYPNGIPIFPENKLSELIPKLRVDDCIFAYSDVSHEQLMHLASRCLAAGASFRLLGPNDTMLKSKKPVISVCAVRTGSGKSQTSRKIARHFKDKGYRVVVIRHPMPYGELQRQAVERFATYSDLKKFDCTIEEREEYEPHLEKGIVVYAGVDYEKILRRAEGEADLIIWDGGNNDFSFYQSDLSIVVADPHRAGHELLYHPGETNFRMADIIIINKADSASKTGIQTVEQNARIANPKALVIRADSRLVFPPGLSLKNKKVLVVEDGPTLTHGGMKFGAGWLAAKRLQAKTIVDAKKFAVGSIRATYEKYPHLQKILPAMGYSPQQIRELEKTINRVPCDLIIDGSPVDLHKLVKTNKPIVRISYELDEKDNRLVNALRQFEKKFLRKKKRI